jgi:hypothetical protein
LIVRATTFMPSDLDPCLSVFICGPIYLWRIRENPRLIVSSQIPSL